MTEHQQDDQIIVVVFKRSLIVMLLAAVAAGIWYISQQEVDEEVVVEEALLIPPKEVETEPQSPPSVKFTDITEAAGIRHQHFNGAYGEQLLPETMGGGVAVLDFNKDQQVDLLFVNSTSWPWRDSDDAAPTSLVLYQGDGNGNFVDVTAAQGLADPIYGMGVAVGDYDSDGWADLFITAVGENRLYRNNAGEGFVDVTAKSGVQGTEEAWSTGAAFVDYDKDGDQDLIVLNYVRWSRDIDLQADYQITGIGRAYGPPAQFAGTNSFFYRNDGDRRFSEVSEEVGIQVNNSATGAPLGKALAVLPVDVDSDSWTDLVVANDTVRNFLFRNLEGSGFEEIGVGSGVAFDNTGLATGAMGIDGATFSETGEHAIAIGNFGNEMTSLYVRPADLPVFTDQAIVTGIGPASRRAVTFGLFFFDYDLDGRADLLQANGHIEPQINVVEPGQEYAQATQLFWNCGAGCARQFVPVDLTGNDLGQKLVGRGAAYADIDRDGDLDVVLTQIGGAPKLLRNDQNTTHNWIQLDVLDASGAAAYGAGVMLTVDGRSKQGRVEPSRSYLSQIESTLTFGIGDASQVDSVTVTWPDGATVTLSEPAVNQRHRVQRP
ncbi:MAG: CRTAC1 family protein [Pseudomonadota bacterium]